MGEKKKPTMNELLRSAAGYETEEREPEDMDELIRKVAGASESEAKKKEGDIETVIRRAVKG